MKVFLDTSVLFAAVLSETGGARLILKLGEAGALSLWVGPWVLKEAEAVLDRKSPSSKGHFALLLNRAKVNTGKKPAQKQLNQALKAIDYLPDAQVIAEAIAIEADYLVSLDRKHILSSAHIKKLPFPAGTPGDFLEWYKEKLMQER